MVLNLCRRDDKAFSEVCIVMATELNVKIVCEAEKTEIQSAVLERFIPVQLGLPSLHGL